MTAPDLLYEHSVTRDHLVSRVFKWFVHELPQEDFVLADLPLGRRQLFVLNNRAHGLLLVLGQGESVLLDATVPGDKIAEAHVDGKAFLAYADNVEHAEVTQLVEHELLVEVVGLLVHVGFNATRVPGCRALEHIDEGLELVTEGIAESRFALGRTAGEGRRAA